MSESRRNVTILSGTPRHRLLTLASDPPADRAVRYDFFVGSFALNSSAEARDPASWRDETAFPVIIAISFCHLLNDTMQSLLQGSYPALKASHHLTFAELGWISLAYQLTASMLQPVVGYVADRRPRAIFLTCGHVVHRAGTAGDFVGWQLRVVAGRCGDAGMGSSVFHPEASRVARMAAGGRHSLAQSLFQLGGNAGQAIGPLLAALIVVQWGQSGIGAFALAERWCRRPFFGTWAPGTSTTDCPVCSGRMRRKQEDSAIPRATVIRGMTILLLLIFSKYAYMSSLTNYYTFYLIERFHLSVVEAQVHLFLFLRFGRRGHAARWLLWRSLQSQDDDPVLGAGRLAVHAHAAVRELAVD